MKNCATSVLLDKLAAKLGFKCREVDVGFKNISAALKRYDALIGGGKQRRINGQRLYFR